jgi:capsular polysaccharide biosynthesis protein
LGNVLENNKVDVEYLSGRVFMIRYILKKCLPEIIKKPLRSIEYKVARALKIPGYIILIKVWYYYGHLGFNKLIRYCKAKPGKFVSLDEYINLHPSLVEVIFRKTKNLFYSRPKFNETDSFELMRFEEQEYNQYAVAFNDAFVYGDSSIIVLKEDLVFYDIYSSKMRKRYRFSDGCIRYYKDKYLVHRGGEIVKEIKEGIWMGGNYSWNYFHFVFEFLIKYDAIKDINASAKVPILVDKVCRDVPQFLELINLLNVMNREIIYIDRWCLYHVEKLYYITCPNFIPPNFVNEKDIIPSDLLFDINSLMTLRSRLLKYGSNRIFPPKIFLSRKKASGRRSFNEEEVFDLLTEYGFSIVIPEELSAVEQISLFSKAEFIAGGSGAAFTNLLYCKRTCKAVIFAKNQLLFSGFSTIASAVGVDLRYITEESVNNCVPRNIHDPFTININNLRKIMNTLSLIEKKE